MRFNATMTNETTVGSRTLLLELPNAIPISTTLFLEKLLLGVHREGVRVLVGVLLSQFEVHYEALAEGLSECPAQVTSVLP